MAENPTTLLKPFLHVVLAILVVPVSFVLFIQLAWRDQTPRGILPDRSDWPDPVQKLEQAVGLPSTTGQRFEVYLLDGQPRTILSEVVCRTNYREELMGRLQSELKLQPSSGTDNNRICKRMNSHGLADDWWSKQDGTAQYFVCQQTHRGDEGPLFTVAFDKQASTIYIHYWFNF